MRTCVSVYVLCRQFRNMFEFVMTLRKLFLFRELEKTRELNGFNIQNDRIFS